MDISYRPRKPRDNPFLIRVAMQTLGRIFEESTGSALTEAMVIEQVEGNQVTTVIERGKKPIGYYSYSILPTGELYLSAVVLAPAAQNKGIGKRVAKKIEREARAKNVDTILGHIQYTNSRSLVFWLKDGFRILGPHMKGMLAVEKKLNGPVQRQPRR